MRTEETEENEMSLVLHYHPLASFCWKVLIALYENGTPFEPLIVDLGDEKSRSRVRRAVAARQNSRAADDAQRPAVPESAIIIDYLDGTIRAGAASCRRIRDLALQARLADQFYDRYVHEPMQKIVTDRIRPAGSNDPYGVEQAQRRLLTVLPMIERDMARQAMGGRATGSRWRTARRYPRCSTPTRSSPSSANIRTSARYLERLAGRPSIARVLEEAGPYMPMFFLDKDREG